MVALLLVGIIGVLLIVGAYQRWPILVDPPLKFADVWSQAALKKLFSKRFLLLFTYFLGLLFLTLALTGLYRVMRYSEFPALRAFTRRLSASARIETRGSILDEIFRSHEYRRK